MLDALRQRFDFDLERFHGAARQRLRDQARDIGKVATDRRDRAFEVGRRPERFDPRRDLPQLPFQAIDVDDRFGGHFPDGWLRRGLGFERALPGGDLDGHFADRRLWCGLGFERALPGCDLRSRFPVCRLRRRIAVEGALPRRDFGDCVVDRHTVRIRGGAITGGSRSGRPLDRTTRRCRRSGQPPIGIVMSFAERSSATLRRQLPRSRLAARQPFQLLGKLVETGVDLIQRAARTGALTLKFADFFWAAFLVAIAALLPRLLIIVALPQLPIVIAAPRSMLVAALPRFPIIVASPRLPLVAPRPRAARPLVVVFVVIIGEQRRLVVVLFVVRFDDVIEPFADRHAGSPRCRAHGFPRLGAQASEIPRTARFHSHDQSHMGGAGCPLRADLAEGRCSRRGPVSPAVDFSGIG